MFIEIDVSHKQKTEDNSEHALVVMEIKTLKVGEAGGGEEGKSVTFLCLFHISAPAIRVKKFAQCSIY